MPNLEHAALTGSQLHEPKDVVSAAALTVYLANGAGSGSWVTLPGTPANIVSVATLTDFPTPISNVITLEPDTGYMIAGNVNIGVNRIVFASNSVIIGTSNRIDRITSSTTGNLFTMTASFSVSDISIVAASAAILNCTGAGSQTEFGIIRNLVIIACDTIGTVNSWGTFVYSQSAVVNMTTGGLIFTGTNERFAISSVGITNTAGIILDLGTATFNTVFIGPDVTFNTAAASTAISMAANSANILAGGRGFIGSCAFRGAGTATVGLATGDLLWVSMGNQGVPDSTIAATGSILGSALSTTFSGTGSGNSVLVNFGTAFIEDITEQFTISTAGKFTYIGKEKVSVLIDATLFAAIAGGATRQYVYTVSKNGTQVASTSSKAEYDGSNPGSNSVSAVLQVVENDTIELRVYAVTATTDLNVDTASIKIRSR